MDKETEGSAFIKGWRACQAGEDGRFANPFLSNSNLNYAWSYGFLEAMDAEENEDPEPENYGCLEARVAEECGDPDPNFSSYED